jgi:hypothetical protein
MRVRVSIDEMRNIVYILFNGVMTDELLISTYAQLSHYVPDNEETATLIDFSEVTFGEVTSRAIRELAASPHLAPKNRLSVLVTPKEVTFGMARMFEILGGEKRPGLRIVRSIDEAYALLGIHKLEVRMLNEW